MILTISFEFYNFETLKILFDLDVMEHTKDKVYIDVPFGPKTTAGVLLSHFERIRHVTNFYKDTLAMRDPLWFVYKVYKYDYLQIW